MEKTFDFIQTLEFLYNECVINERQLCMFCNVGIGTFNQWVLQNDNTFESKYGVFKVIYDNHTNTFNIIAWYN